MIAKEAGPAAKAQETKFDKRLKTLGVVSIIALLGFMAKEIKDDKDVDKVLKKIIKIENDMASEKLSVLDSIARAHPNDKMAQQYLINRDRLDKANHTRGEAIMTWRNPRTGDKEWKYPSLAKFLGAENEAKKYLMEKYGKTYIVQWADIEKSIKQTKEELGTRWGVKANAKLGGNPRGDPQEWLRDRLFDLKHKNK